MIPLIHNILEIINVIEIDNVGYQQSSLQNGGYQRWLPMFSN